MATCLGHDRCGWLVCLIAGGGVVVLCLVVAGCRSGFT